jgi:hypothetical protein
VSTKNFEDVLISAACKKKQEKLQQKERESWTLPALLTYAKAFIK